MTDFLRYMNSYFPKDKSIKESPHYGPFYELIYNLNKDDFTRLTKIYKITTNKTGLREIFYAIYNEDIPISRLIEILKSNNIDDGISVLLSDLSILKTKYSKAGFFNKSKKLRELYNMKLHINTTAVFSYMDEENVNDDINASGVDTSEISILNIINKTSLSDIREIFFTKYKYGLDIGEKTTLSLMINSNYVTLFSALLNFDSITSELLIEMLKITNISLTDYNKELLLSKWKEIAEKFRDDLKKLDKGVLHY